MLEIWLVVALAALAVMMGLGHAWLLMALTGAAAAALAVGSGVQMRRFGIDGVFPFHHHDRKRQV